ncbi:MAG: chromate transporter [Tenericutes bacterium HGW-Tenericutes-8]|nr:MAG: chromate transporter [Tenericutes bacterium HGW-Tenericutes-8]
MKKNEYLDIFLTFFKIGLFTFGGGYAMIGVMHKDIVEKKKWIDDETMLELITISEATPGPFAINGATYIGYQHKKFLGALCATLGVVLPSFIVIILVSIFLQAFSENIFIQNGLKGISAGVSVLIFNALFKLSKKVKMNVINVSLMVIAFLVAFFTNFSIILLLLMTGILGFLYALYKGGKKI